MHKLYWWLQQKSFVFKVILYNSGIAFIMHIIPFQRKEFQDSRLIINFKILILLLILIFYFIITNLLFVNNKEQGKKSMNNF